MSTYIVAFHISDFAHVQSTSSNIPHRIFTRSNAINQTSNALRSSELLLDALSEYIGMEYVLPKLDSVGLPSFGGAMENYGLATYRYI